MEYNSSVKAEETLLEFKDDSIGAMKNLGKNFWSEVLPEVDRK